MRINLCLLILLAITPLLASPSVPTRDDQPLDAIPVIAETRYCYENPRVFSVWFKLRVKYVNRTDEKMILDREIGKTFYREKVARSLEDLAAGKYEYNPNRSWLFAEKDKRPDTPKMDSPGSDFVVLSPGETFEGGVNATVFAPTENRKISVGVIMPGTHVLQMEISAWSHPGEQQEYAKAWRKFGELVTGVVKTEPLEIRIPSNPSVEKNCQ